MCGMYLKNVLCPVHALYTSLCIPFWKNPGYPTFEDYSKEVKHLNYISHLIVDLSYE